MKILVIMVNTLALIAFTHYSITLPVSEDYKVYLTLQNMYESQQEIQKLERKWLALCDQLCTDRCLLRWEYTITQRIFFPGWIQKCRGIEQDIINTKNEIIQNKLFIEIQKKRLETYGGCT